MIACLTWFAFRAMKIILNVAIIITLTTSLRTQAQTDTVFFDGRLNSLAVNSSLRYFSASSDINIDSVWASFRKKFGIKKNAPVNFGSINGFFWLALTIKNVTHESQDLFLKIKQPHIYQIYFYQVNRKPELLYQAGLYFPFHSRPVPVRNFAFPIQFDPNESFTALIKIHHVNSLSVPLYLETNRELLTTNYQQNLGWGFWSGFISFCSLLALIGWIVIRKSVFAWYFLYMLSVVLFGLTEQGYSFQFFFPNHPEFSATAIVDTGLLPFTFMIKFTQSLLETRKYLLWSHRLINWIFTFILAMIALGFLIPDFMFKITPILLPFLNVVILFSLGLLAYIGIKSLQTNRTVAIFYLTAYGILVLCSVFTILNVAFGVFNYFGPNPILLGYLTEAILLSVAIAIFFQRINNERVVLSNKVAVQQKEMYQHYITGIEKERTRIAGELHDDVGSRLSYLKRLIQNQQEQSNKAVDQLDFLIDDVRKLSHDLAPPMAHVSGLAPLLEKLIEDQRRASGINIIFQVHNFKNGLTQFHIQQLYRIVQEAISNAIRHAQCSQIDVQLFGHEESLDLIIEDNGQGFDSTVISGFGINQMKIRTESLGGRIEIDSHSGKGTTILIQIPLKY